MPKLEMALFEYLSNDPGVSALVENRIYPNKLKEGCNIPAISWNRVSARRIYTHDSFEDTDAWVQARIQINCWSNTPVEAMEVGEAVLVALSGFEGDMSGQLVGSSFADNEFDEYQAPTKYHRRIMDFLISYEDDVDAAS
jgi:Protein of unknown function (DUF3168)